MSLSCLRFFCVTMMKMMFENSWRERNENAKKRENFGERKHNDFLQKSVRFYTLGNGWISKCKKVWFSLQFFSDLSHQIKVNFHVGNKDYVLPISFGIAVLWIFEGLLLAVMDFDEVYQIQRLRVCQQIFAFFKRPIPCL